MLTMKSSVATVAQGLVVIPLLLVLYTLLRVLYNIFLHPLRSYPGPLLARATLVTSQRKQIKGQHPHWLHQLHLRYGPVVRFAPNELSFTDPQVWKDVYSHRATAFVKSKQFYGPDMFGNPPGLIRADNAGHARQRKLVSHAFSDKALKEQEVMLKEYAELLINQLKKATKSSVDGKVNMEKWYNFTTFDIMADLTFGEPLKLLESTAYTPWVRSLFESFTLIMFTSVIRAWPGLTTLLQTMLPASAKQKRILHMRHSIDRVDKRLARKTDRPDIWTYVTRYTNSEENQEKGLSQTEMYSNAAVFMLAGTETTATELSGMTYYLLKDPLRMKRLKDEIRNAFQTFEDMTMTRLARLEYLGACIEEGLRIYPPISGGLPRTTPKGGAAVGGHWVPEGTTVQLPMYAAHHSPSNFKNPDLFVPERWLPEGQQEYASDRKDVVQPFSSGPRNCLGKNLANHEMRLVLASVLWHFDMEFCEESKGWLDQRVYILWDKGPLMVKLTSIRE